MQCFNENPTANIARNNGSLLPLVICTGESHARFEQVDKYILKEIHFFW